MFLVLHFKFFFIFSECFLFAGKTKLRDKSQVLVLAGLECDIYLNTIKE